MKTAQLARKQLSQQYDLKLQSYTRKALIYWAVAYNFVYTTNSQRECLTLEENNRSQELICFSVITQHCVNLHLYLHI